MNKPLLTFFLAAGIATSAVAQVPELKSRSLVLKFTENWCGPCGAWGWDLAEDVIGDVGDKGYYIGVMGSSSPGTMNANCYAAFESNYTVTGYPTFIVNDADGGYSLSGIQSLYSSYYTTTPVASTAGAISLSGNTLSVVAKTRFWSATSGEYYLSAFVVEDKVMAAQASQSGLVAHHNLLRGSMMPDKSPWGQQLATGTIAANTELLKAFSMTIPDGWNKENLSVILAIYKKEGGKYKFINTIKATNGNVTSVEEVAGLAGLTLYPNPSHADHTWLALSLEEAGTLRVTVTDITGRKVYATGDQRYAKGDSRIAIPTAALPGGVYAVSVRSDKGVSTRSLVIAK